MNKVLIVVISIFASMAMKGQVGVGTTSPNAALDITSTDDGLLIPRVSLTMTTAAAPLTTPTVSELVYNIATVADVTPGYYYWDGIKWISLTGTVTSGNDWTLLGNASTNAATNFLGTTDTNDLVFRTNNLERFRNFNATGNTTFGSATDNDAKISSDILAGDSANIGVNVVNNHNTAGSGSTYSALFTNNSNNNGSKYGIRNVVSVSGTNTFRVALSNRIVIPNIAGSTNYGIYNRLEPSVSTPSNIYGVFNEGLNIATTVSGTMYGVYNNFNFSPSSTGVQYGTYNMITTTNSDRYGTYNNMNSNIGAFGTGTGLNAYGVYNEMRGNGNQTSYAVYSLLNSVGTGNKYASYNSIPSSAGGLHYGVYSDVLSPTGFAGYFLGRFSIGTAAGNEYILPSSRGTAGQIMITDGTGNVSWVSPTHALRSINNASNVYPINNVLSSGVYQILDTDYTVRISNSILAINLPDASRNNGKIFILIGINGISAKNLTTAGGAVIDDVTNTVITSIKANERYMLQSDGTNWFVIGK